MVYRIPSDDEVARSIDDCLARCPHMRSQRELWEAVSADLTYRDPLYRVGAERVRRIGIERGIITLEISYASSDRPVGDLCPVCGNPMTSVRNRTLDGGTVEMSRSCRRCGYVAKGSETKPSRYGIGRRAKVDPDTRIGMLREAQTLLLRAADLMDGALRMSGLESRSGDDSKTIRRIAGDPAYGGSLRNLALDMERLEDDPLWTRPLDSPKRMFDKDLPRRRLAHPSGDVRREGAPRPAVATLMTTPAMALAMKIWEFAKAEGSSIKMDSWMSDTMGLVDGGVVYSTLFKHPAEGPKDYEIILSVFPQENYRTLTHITMYLDDVPGSSAQASEFLASREINILNSVSLNGISDTVIVWKLMADMNFAGEADILRETFETLKASDDPSVSKIRRIDIKPADIGRLFKGATDNGGKEEIRRGYPTIVRDGRFDVADQYGDILKDIDGKNVLITMDADSWILSVTFFKEGTRLVKAGLEMPDCPGGIGQVLEVIAGWNINLISVFSKVKICYETMYLELVMDIGKSDLSFDEIRDRLPGSLEGLNGVYSMREFSELR